MESFAGAYQQLASISAVLGGLAFTAAAALLNAGASTTNPDALDRPAKITAGTAVASAIFLIIAALIWSFMTTVATLATNSLPTNFSITNGIASISLIIGAIFLFVSIGASGWIGSRRLGLLTSVGAAVGGLIVISVLYWFARF